MNKEQTRLLGIEFERKLQTIDPTEKFATKVDTQDIYAYLNMYQEQYIKQLYTLDLLALSETRPSNRVLDILQPLICSSTDDNPLKVDNYRTSFALPDDYWLFSRASVGAFGTYKNNKSLVSLPCIELKQQDLQSVLDTGFDEDRIIRTPVIELKQLPEVIHDKYTDILSVMIRYIRKPKKFSVGKDSADCELPMNSFEDLVNGAVDLYFNDKYKLAIASAAARRRAKKDDDDDDTTKS